MTHEPPHVIMSWSLQGPSVCHWLTMFYIDIFLKIENCEGRLYLDKYDSKGQHFCSLIHVNGRNYCHIPCVTTVQCNRSGVQQCSYTELELLLRVTVRMSVVFGCIESCC